MRRAKDDIYKYKGESSYSIFIVVFALRGRGFLRDLPFSLPRHFQIAILLDIIIYSSRSTTPKHVHAQKHAANTRSAHPRRKGTGGNEDRTPTRDNRTTDLALTSARPLLSVVCRALTSLLKSALYCLLNCRISTVVVVADVGGGGCAQEVRVKEQAGASCLPCLVHSICLFGQQSIN